MIVFLGAFLLYFVTMPPDLLWGGGDFALFQTQLYLGELPKHVDAFFHPLWTLIGHPFTRWFPLGNPAWRANLFTVFIASLTTVVVFVNIRAYVANRIAAWLGIAALVLSHTFWTYAVMPKVYALNALLLAVAAYLIIKWSYAQEKSVLLFASSFLIGIGTLNHLVMLVVILGYLGFALQCGKRGRRDIIRISFISGAGLLTGIIPYLIATFVLNQDGGTSSLIMDSLGALIRNIRQPASLLKAAGWAIFLGVYQFPISFLAGGIGLFLMWKGMRQVFWLVAGAMFGTFCFLLAFADPNVGGPYVWNLHYYLQSYVLFSFAIAVGFEWVVKRLNTARGSLTIKTFALIITTIAPIFVYLIAPILVQPFLANVPDFRTLNGRDNLRYVLQPWKFQETGARAVAQSLLDDTPTNGVLFADYSLWAMARYMTEVEHQRSDITLVNLTNEESQLAAIQRFANSRPLILADTYRYYDLTSIEKFYSISPHGTVFLLKPKT